MSSLRALPAARTKQDFPHYAGDPVAFSARHWALLLLSVAAGFLVLELLPAANLQTQLLSRLLFLGIPLGTLFWAAGRHAKALFGRVTARDVPVMVLAAVLSILLAFAAALLVRQFAPVAPNALAVGMADMSVPDLVLNLLSTAPQLLGEEMLTILPFLALLWLATSHLGLGRRGGIALALLGSTLVFCGAHLPTYGWNWAQCFGVIGASRVVLTLRYQPFCGALDGNRAG